MLIIGDVVVCTSEPDCSLDFGSVHTVSGIDDRGFVSVDEVPNYFYHESCFRKEVLL